MSAWKTVAVWGAPRSGKTTFACRMGMALAGTLRPDTLNPMSVVVVSPDLETPALPLLFPHRDRDELPSMGDLLSRPDGKDRILETLVTAEKGGKEADGLAYLGYGPCDNPSRYPVPSPRAAAGLWEALTEQADVVIADLPDSVKDPFSACALKRAEVVFRLLTPDLHAAVWEASHRERYARRDSDPPGAERETDWEKQIPGEGNPDGMKNRPSEDFRKAVTAFRFAMPFRKEWQTAMAEGKLAFLPCGARERLFWQSLLKLGEERRG